jgi:hypothetical protein
MQTFIVTKGATSQIITLSIYDSSSTTGAKLTGLTNASGSLTAYYNRQNSAGAATAISLVSATKGTWTSSGFIAVDGTNMPGDYELHLPDAAIASAAGVHRVAIQLKGATNMVPVNALVLLTSADLQDTVRAGLTALPNAAAEAAGGLYTRGSGAGQITQDGNGRIDTNFVAMGGNTTKAANLTSAADAMITDSVTTAGFSPTTTEFEAATIATAATGHWIGRIVIFTSGTLIRQQGLITAYSLVSGRGHFTVSTLTSAPANAVTFIIV